MSIDPEKRAQDRSVDYLSDYRMRIGPKKLSLFRRPACGLCCGTTSRVSFGWQCVHQSTYKAAQRAILEAARGSFGIADWQTAVGFNMLPYQPPFGVSDIRVQDLRPGVDTVRQVHGDIKVRRITAEHTVKGNAPSMAFHAGCRRPVKCAYPLAYPPAAPRPTDVDRVLGAAARN